jgi:ribosomal protein S18 acetylase RimI-like enzyme
VRYRLYRPDDFDSLYALEAACFEPPLRFPRSYMRRLVISGRSATWLAEDDSNLAGFAIVEWLRGASGAVAYIETLEVAPGKRGQGIGRELLTRLEDSARAAGAHTIWLHVDDANAPALHLYEAQKYELKGREENFYGHGRPARIYAKPLLAAESTATDSEAMNKV